jgi:hypothetical protein
MYICEIWYSTTESACPAKWDNKLTRESSVALELRTLLYTWRKALLSKSSLAVPSLKHSVSIPAWMCTGMVLSLTKR